MEYSGGTGKDRPTPPTPGPQNRREDAHNLRQPSEIQIQSVPPTLPIIKNTAKAADIEELFRINNQTLPPVASPDFEDAMYLDSVAAVYTTVYAPALDKFLESRWYTKSGLNTLQSNAKLFGEFVAFLRAAEVHPDEPSPPNLLARESRLIWSLLNMCCPGHTTAYHLNNSDRNTVDYGTADTYIFAGSPGLSETDTASAKDGASHEEDIDLDTRQLPEAQVLETATSTETPHTACTGLAIPSRERTAASVPSERLNSITSLLIDSVPLQSSQQHHPTAPESDADIYQNLDRLDRQLQARQDEFWSSVTEYVCAAEGEAGETARRTAIQQASALLDGRENRDVVYTIMRLRCLQRRRGRLAEAGLISRREGDCGDGGEQKWEVTLETEWETEREWDFCMSILRNEAGLAGEGEDGVTSGMGRNVVAMRVAGMALTAFSM